jgi:hypothetical protein
MYVTDLMEARVRSIAWIDVLEDYVIIPWRRILYNNASIQGM